MLICSDLLVLVINPVRDCHYCPVRLIVTFTASEHQQIKSNMTLIMVDRLHPIYNLLNNNNNNNNDRLTAFDPGQPG